jgi:hypothetical protein
MGLYATQEWVKENNLGFETQELTNEQKTQARTNLGIPEKLATEEYVDYAISTKADKTDIVQADWNENAPDSNSHIKNRTHYEYEGTKTLISTSGTYSGSWNWIEYGTADFANIWIEGNVVGIEYINDSKEKKQKTGFVGKLFK